MKKKIVFFNSVSCEDLLCDVKEGHSLEAKSNTLETFKVCLNFKKEKINLLKKLSSFLLQFKRLA